jgi:AcrR family transcriptional regulator
VLDHGTGAVSVKAIAADAGVSRQLAYFHFRNRAGLLTAMAHHRDEAGGFGREVAAARDLPPVAALEALLRDWCAYLPEMLRELVEPDRG